MSNTIIVEDLGLLDYGKAWELQETRHASLISQPDDERFPDGYLLFVEHPNVYTLGQHGNRNNLLVDPDFLKKIEATYYQVNRGGDITYHGPGQMVVYPVFDIRRFTTGIKDYVFRLEEAVIGTLRHYGIGAGRLRQATGVWLDPAQPSARKICAIGIRASRGVSMHGFAFNINTRLEYFRWINPCGFVDKGVTSLEKELGHPVEMNTIKQLLLEELCRVFDATIVQNRTI